MDYNIPFTTGNTARVFFEKYEQVAKLLEVPEFLVHDLGVMWEAVVASVPIDPEKFGNFCELFVAKFSFDPTINWYEFSPTLHKVIVHGRQVMEFFDIPLGWLSEGQF